MHEQQQQQRCHRAQDKASMPMTKACPTPSLF